MIVLPFLFNIDFGAFLAVHHFNQRSNAVVPNLSSILVGCDLYLTLKVFDTQFSPHQTGKLLTKILTSDAPDDTTTIKPTAVIGTTSSSTSATSATLTSALKIPQVSCCATSRSLNPLSQPFFGRTIPSNQGDARAMIAYLSNLGVTHLGVLHVDNTYGREFANDIKQDSIRCKVNVMIGAFNYDDTASMDLATARVAQAEVRYIFAVVSSSHFPNLLVAANASGLVGDEYVWLFSENFSELTTDEPVFNSTEDALTIKALNGSGVVLFSVPDHEGYNQEALNFHNDAELQDFYVNSHDNMDTMRAINFTEWNYGSSFYGQLNYDATMALAISTCKAGKKEADFPTGPELYENLMKVGFEGATGYVKIDPETAARSYQGITFTVYNLIADDPDPVGNVQFRAHVSSTIDLASNKIKVDVPFIYAGGTTETPLSLPPLEETDNLVPQGILIFGYVVCSLLMLTTLYWLCWTTKYRKRRVVKSAQPLFLAMLCVGVLLMASSIIPLSFQDGSFLSQESLDVACMATPYLLSVGFTTCFAALSSKLYRIRVLIKASKNFKRVIVRAKDVMIPFACLLFFNIGILIAWTFVAPLEWTRVPQRDSFDKFGRASETSGACRADDSESAMYFTIALLGVNFVSLGACLFQSFKSRDLPIEYSESFYIALTTGCLFEALLVGFPVMWVASENETAKHVVALILIAICCLAILLPIFLPKSLATSARRSTGGTRYVKNSINGEGILESVSSWRNTSTNPGSNQQRVSVRTGSHKRYSASHASNNSTSTGFFG